MGVLAASGFYIDVACERCRSRLQNVRIGIAALGVECEAPEFWPTRGFFSPAGDATSRDVPSGGNTP
jgi:hypothetical protein